MGKPSKNLQNSKEIIYLSLDELLIIHTDQIERYGGSHGIRDIGLIESALYRPQSSFGGDDLYSNIFDKGAVFVHSLLLNHGFVDGNKRTAIASFLVFLMLNSFRLEVEQDALITFALSIENKQIVPKDISSWLQRHSSPSSNVK